MAVLGKKKKEIMEDKRINSVHSTVFKESDSLEGKCTKIEGYDFNQGINYSKLLKSMLSTGFQASNLGEAMEIVNEMVGFIYLDFFFVLVFWMLCLFFFFY